MLFKQELAKKILTGDKTQTRRPIKAGEQFIEHDGLKTVLTAGGRIKIQVGRDYAVQNGRCASCSMYHPETLHMVCNPDISIRNQYKSQYGYSDLRILVTDIRCEDVRQISYLDSLAEGFNGEMGFWRVWTTFYDPDGWSEFVDYGGDDRVRPDELYQAWVYTFELVGGGE